MCKRLKNPFIGKYNLVGGKVENGNYLEEAYRELEEESGITKSDISITHLMNFTYTALDYELQVYYGWLNKDVVLVEEVNKLEWISLDNNFFDIDKFAGDGNIGHILLNVESVNNK